MIKQFLNKTIPIFPLISFRIGFGILMLFGLVRSLMQGWVYELYVKPQFFFSFYGFENLPRVGETLVYIIYAMAIISAILISIGLFYRFATIGFFLCFTYLELYDATNYLNHYYLICLFAFLLIFLPANKSHSLDVKLGFTKASDTVSAWMIYLIMAQIGIVYTYAGLAKLHPEWISEAMPLTIWLNERAHWPILGTLFSWEYSPILFSFFGAFYDLFIFWFLLFKKTRPWAYAAVVVFHLLTWSMFNIGLFPLIMITSNIIFFSASWHKRVLGRLGGMPKSAVYARSVPPGFVLYMCIQLILPLRFLFYNSQLLWAEEGYRFGWRVMLVEKSGLAHFTLKTSDHTAFEVDNSKFLTPFQEKQMAIQPDFIVQYAHYLGEYYSQQLQRKDLRIFVDAHVALNGRVSHPFINPKQDLLLIEDGFKTKQWIITHPDL